MYFMLSMLTLGTEQKYIIPENGSVDMCALCHVKMLANSCDCPIFPTHVCLFVSTFVQMSSILSSNTVIRVFYFIVLSRSIKTIIYLKLCRAPDGCENCRTMHINDPFFGGEDDNTLAWIALS